MYPLILSTTLSFLSVHSSLLGKQILKWVNRPSGKEIQLLNQKSELKYEQSNMNMTENFAKYSKIQRKINAIDTQLSQYRNDKNSLSLQLGLTYGTKFVLAITLVVLSIYYRHSPVFELGSNIDLVPFNYIICYPNQDNHVSFHFWVLCCSSIARLIKF